MNLVRQGVIAVDSTRYGFIMYPALLKEIYKKGKKDVDTRRPYVILSYTSLIQRLTKLSKQSVPKEMIQKHFKKTFDKTKAMW